MTEEKKVYLVTQAWSDGYSVLGVFDSGALAQRFVDEYPFTESERRDVEIEPWAVNGLLPRMDRGLWWFRVTVARNGKPLGGWTENTPEPGRDGWELHPANICWGGSVLVGDVEARSLDHARELAHAERERLLASGEWDTMLEENLRK